MSELAQLAEKHENAVNHFKTEIVNLKEEIAELKKQVCRCDNSPEPKVASVPKAKPVRRKVARRKK